MKGLEAAPARVWGPWGCVPQPQPDSLLPGMPFLERRPTPGCNTAPVVRLQKIIFNKCSGKYENPAGRISRPSRSTRRTNAVRPEPRAMPGWPSSLGRGGQTMGAQALRHCFQDSWAHAFQRQKLVGKLTSDYYTEFGRSCEQMELGSQSGSSVHIAQLRLAMKTVTARTHETLFTP